MKKKSFKTVSGYLRSHTGLDISVYGMSKEQRIAEHRAQQRRTIDHLLPQLGLPKLDADEQPIDGVKRLIGLGGTATQIKALKDVERWLKNYIIVIGSHAIPQVKTAEGLVSYKVTGFSRNEGGGNVTMIVDANPNNFSGDGTAHAIAEALAPDYCFPLSGNLTHLVPNSAKNRLFFSDEELYAAVPEMRPRRITRRKKTLGGLEVAEQRNAELRKQAS